RETHDAGGGAQPARRGGIRLLPLLERARVDSHCPEAPAQGRRAPARAARAGQARVRVEPTAEGGDRMEPMTPPAGVAGLETYRRFFAEEIQACAGLRNQALVEAFATIPREQFLRPGPWTTRSEADF